MVLAGPVVARSSFWAERFWRFGVEGGIALARSFASGSRSRWRVVLAASCSGLRYWSLVYWGGSVLRGAELSSFSCSSAPSPLPALRRCLKVGRTFRPPHE